MRSTPEAPVTEPQQLRSPSPQSAGAPPYPSRAFVTPSASSRRSALDLAAAPGEVVGLVGPSGCGKSTLLELVAGLASRRAGGSRWTTPRARRAPGALRLHAAARPAAPVAARDRQRRPALRNRGKRRARPAARPPLFDRLGLARLRARLPASSRAGCASASPSCARCSPASPCCCSTSPSPRSTRSPAREMQEWLRRGARSGAAQRAPRHPRRRGGSLPLRPRGVLSAAPGAGHRAARSAGAARAPTGRGRHRARVRRRARARARALRGERGETASRRPALVLLALLGAWELAARWDLLADALDIEHFLIPAPTDIAESLWETASCSPTTAGSR